MDNGVRGLFMNRPYAGPPRRSLFSHAGSRKKHSGFRAVPVLFRLSLFLPFSLRRRKVEKETMDGVHPISENAGGNVSFLEATLP